MNPEAISFVMRQTHYRGPFVPLAKGFTTDVFSSADDMIIRIPRDAESGSRLEHEVLLLKRLRPQLRTTIPGPAQWWRPKAGIASFGFMTYPRVPGRVLDRDSFSNTVSAWVSDLMTVFEDLRAQQGGMGGSRPEDAGVWVQRELVRATRLETLLAPFLTAAERRRWRQWFATEARIYDRFPLGYVSLAHKDLWWDNMLFTDAHRLAGILDWEWAGLDDPALDLAGLREAGPEVVDAIITAFVELYPEPLPRLRRKVDVMWALRALQGLEWARCQGDEPEWEEGMAKLRSGPILS